MQEPNRSEIGSLIQEPGQDWGKVVTLIIASIALLNALILDFLVGSSRGEGRIEQQLKVLEERVDRLFNQETFTSSQETTVSAQEAQATPTPSSLEEQLKEKLAKMEKASTPTPSLPLVPVVTPTPEATSQVKEFYIPLGTGSARSESYDWKDTGAEAVVDLANYPGIREVKFEVTVSVPSGQVEIRLYNASDGYPIGGSTLTGEGDSPKLYRSGNIVLAAGSKTYRVQMRTSLTATASLDNARIKILVN